MLQVVINFRSPYTFSEFKELSMSENSTILENGAARIIHVVKHYSCFEVPLYGPLVYGDAVVDIYDDRYPDCNFLVILSTTSNLGAGSQSFRIGGPEEKVISIHGIDVMIEMSDWHCDQNSVSVVVTATAKKLGVSCTIFDHERIQCSRHNPNVMTARISELDERLRAFLSR